MRTDPFFGSSSCHGVWCAVNPQIHYRARCRDEARTAAFAAPWGCNMAAHSVDILAIGFFILEWAVYAVTLEHTAYGRDSLSARMHVYPEVWIRRLLDRETRMVDTQIMASL